MRRRRTRLIIHVDDPRLARVLLDEVHDMAKVLAIGTRKRRLRRRLHALALAVVVVTTAGLLAACEVTVADFAVDSTTDATDAAPGDGLCATAADECTLRAAIQEANATNGRVEITLAPGSEYVLTVAGAGEELAATGDLDVLGSVIIHGNDATLDGNDLDRLSHVRNGGRLVLRDVTVTNGRAPFGGGLRVDEGGYLELQHATVADNEATDHTGCTARPPGQIICNDQIGGGGGISTAGRLSMEYSTVAQNRATDAIPCTSFLCLRQGGGIDVTPTGQASFVGVTFS